LAVGDFNNDGEVEIVSGWPGYLYSWDDTWIQYFTYDSVSPILIQHWLFPGVYAVCTNPVIGDFDNDLENELFASGFGGHSFGSNGSGSAFIWKRTSADTGQVVWWDTTSMIYAPSGATAGMIDSTLCIINNVIYWVDGYFTLFGNHNNQYQRLWQSFYFHDHTFSYPISICDVDQDGKMEFVDGEDIGPAPVTWKICDWEQIASGIGFQPIEFVPHSFVLHQNIPNPFNGSTVITFELSCPSSIDLTIFDIAGRMVLDWKQDNLAPGQHSYTWQASHLSSGIYLVTLHAAGNIFTQKAVLLK